MNFMRLISRILIAFSLVLVVFAGELSAQTKPKVKETGNVKTSLDSKAKQSAKQMPTKKAKAVDKATDQKNQGPESPEESKTAVIGRSTEQPRALSEEEKKPFSYRPYDEEFWQEFQKFIQKKELSNAIKFASKQIGKLTTNKEKEGELALAVALEQSGHPAMSALLLKKIINNAIGSRVAEYGLHLFDLLARKKYADPIDVESVVVGQEISANHWENKAFLSSFRAGYALKFGLIEWYKAELPFIVEESYWFQHFEYLKSLGLIARKKVQEGYAIIKKMAEDQATMEPLKQVVLKQYARILFEERRFEKALEIYQKLDLPLREWGRTLLEQAWAYYYLKKFDKALGVLQALKTPYLSSSPSIESHLLEMIIYKDLCHYKRVEAMAKSFRKDFKSALQKIKKREQLRSVNVLAKVAVLDSQYQPLANLISQLRKEKRDLDKTTDGFNEFDSLLKIADLKAKEIEARLEVELESKVRSIANELLDIEEQVLFLEYTSKLDALRIRLEDEKNIYKKEERPTTSFEKIYWPIDREKWLDEIKDYKVLIENKCLRKGK